MDRRRPRNAPAGPGSSGNALRSARPQPVRPNGTVTVAQFKRLSERVGQMESELAQIKMAWERIGISRDQIEKNGADLDVQFQRIAMMQAEIDRLKANETALQNEISRLRAKALVIEA
jgi:uncharacterized small protein (DUF1192 family)